MRRSSMVRTHRRRNAFLYSTALIALLTYGVPRLPKLQHGLPGTFAFLWIIFAGLALASNLYFLVGADKERSRLISARKAGVIVNTFEEDTASEPRRAH